MNKFVETADSYHKPMSKHRNWVFDIGKPDPLLGKAVCAAIIRTTPKFTWRRIYCLLRPAV